ncbi:sporulation peptidase YabG [Dehalobacterium formicoaceticum]|uniref:Sporulation peptidase YabG n=1 Tax=Dehalobacterium formicoaceticum TaxID=51515 RepID=A0ABT1Y2X1_9FIRM|nr:sporulation peptidase YabG [Dehalobacterium formicoaceticum]MCR6545224.1 sporulation peptidase YabG [Dehalobacterium formicoaceticum]
MNKIQAGDIVARRSYGFDIIFRVKAIYENQAGKLIAILKGVDIRLVADAPLEDLVPIVNLEYNRYRNVSAEQNNEKLNHILTNRRISRDHGVWRSNALNLMDGAEYFDMPGKVLHIDGDEEYLKKCLDAYQKLKIPCHGFSIPEQEQPKLILHYLQKHQPDILVITGHDGLTKDAFDFRSMDSYRNSRHFIETVKAARRFIPGRDDLVIFAGACQSYYEEILKAGANFASSPRRVFIHIFDPVFIVEKIAYTSIKETLTLNDVLANTVTGIDGVGGIETRGCFRLGYPKSPY